MFFFNLQISQTVFFKRSFSEYFLIFLQKNMSQCQTAQAVAPMFESASRREAAHLSWDDQDDDEQDDDEQDDLDKVSDDGDADEKGASWRRS